MHRNLLIITGCQSTPMTDPVDIAQLKLEGRCTECAEKLPKHLLECSQHPRKYVLKAIDMWTQIKQQSDEEQ